jgi:hypothetical protein
MKLSIWLPLLTVGVLLVSPLAYGAKSKVKTEQVVELTRFLEENPLDESAPGIRALLIDWEEKSKDVVDYICPGVLDPVLVDGVPNSSELMVQFIFGSAAHQIANPSDKGKVIPGQLAGMRSMLKAYSAFLAADAAAKIQRLDELSEMDISGGLDRYLAPIVKDCGDDP